MFSALRVDGNVGQSHPVVAPNGPFFDTITYSKGASLLRMISNTLGASVMQQGLQQYLKDHQYANANHEDYFRALTT
uniref:Peptidase M1 membrane alanine aminopeptidase domain-containing protein n=1 Tax=Plectus sambesii TaxID=2011161 RepID=A0A914VJN1_9BILA